MTFNLKESQDGIFIFFLAILTIPIISLVFTDKTVYDSASAMTMFAIFFFGICGLSLSLKSLLVIKNKKEFVG